MDYFVTLASNADDISQPRMRELLKRWDARINRFLNQGKWAQRPDERLYWAAFPEKQEVNPHWHLLVQIDPEITNAARKARADQFPERGGYFWKRLLLSGTFDCQRIYTDGAVGYSCKDLYNRSNYDEFVLSREFQNLK